MTNISVIRRGDEDPHPLRIQPGNRDEEVMAHLNISNVCLEELKFKAAKHHAQREVEFCPRQAVAYQ